MRRTSAIITDLRAVRAFLAAELRILRGWLREPGLWLLLGLALLLWTLAYSMPFAQTLHIGGDRRTALREYDAPFLVNFNASEPDDKQEPPWRQRPDAPYRWAEDYAKIQLPGIGSGSWLISLRVSGQSGNTGLVSRWNVGNQPAFDVALSPDMRIYHVLAAAPDGDLRLSFTTPRLLGAGDLTKRNLAMVVYGMQATSLRNQILLPAPGILALLTLMLLMLYAVLYRLLRPDLASQRHSARASWLHLSLLGLILVTAALLISDRLGLTIWLPAATVLAALCYLIVALGETLLAWLLPVIGFDFEPQEWRPALGMLVAGFAIRMAGLLHPYTQDSDLGFHVNNLKKLASGLFFQTGGLPCEAGAGNAPYPPAQSIVLLPGLLFDSGDAWLRLWLRGCNALLESAGALLIWLLLRRANAGQRVALLGAVLYSVAVPLLKAYSIGEMANIFGQIWLPILLLSLFSLGQGKAFLSAKKPSDQISELRHQPKCRDRPSALLASLFILLIMFSHTGVTISAVALLAAWWLLGLGRESWRMQIETAACWLAAVGVALLLFYSAYAYLPAQNQALAAERLAADPQALCPPVMPFTTKLLNTLNLGIGPYGSIALPLLLAAIVGTLVSANPALRRLLVASWLGTLLSFATLMTSAQPVRWAHFLFPALCVGAAITMGHWLRRGRSGRLLGWVLVAYIVYFGLERWIVQLATYLH